MLRVEGLCAREARRVLLGGLRRRGLLLVVVRGPLLNDLVRLGALNHPYLAEVGQEVRPHHVVLKPQLGQSGWSSLLTWLM